MFDVLKVYRRIEFIAVFLSFVSVLFLFFNHFVSLFLAGWSAIIASAGMLMYALKSDRLYFSKLLLYSLLISSVPLLIIFFKAFKY